MARQSYHKADVYDVITDRIITLLEEGTIPWRKPWTVQGIAPANLVSGKAYRDINVMLLGCQAYDSPYWLSYRQAQELGGHVVKGSKGSPCVFWRVEVDREENPEVPGPQANTPGSSARPRFIARYYTVFNLEQTEGVRIPKGRALNDAPLPEHKPIPACEAILSGFTGRPSLAHGGHRAFYRPSTDHVQMPEAGRFASPEEYYSTLFHELTHSTGHASRLARPGVVDPSHFGSHDYSREELVAEMGAAFLSGHAGIEPATLGNSAAYIDSWLGRLRDRENRRWLVQAGAQAQKAADHILGIQHGQA